MSRYTQADEPVSRRACFAPLIAALGAMVVPAPAWAGAQIEEPLIDSVRTALSSAVRNAAPPVPEFTNTEARLNYILWLGAMSERLKKKKAALE